MTRRIGLAQSMLPSKTTVVGLSAVLAREPCHNAGPSRTDYPTGVRPSMPRSQNATFHGPEPESEGERIRGISIARCLSAELKRGGWHVGEMDCWRDAGYVFTIERNGDALQIVAMAYHGTADGWILLIAPARLPSVIRRWLGGIPSASPDCVFGVAIDCQRILKDDGFTDFRWCWDDLADSDDCGCSPPPPP